MTTNQITSLMELYEHGPFILQAIEKVIDTVGQKVETDEVFRFICRGIKTGELGIFMQFEGGKPHLICVAAVRTTDLLETFVEIIMVSNTPNAEPHEGLEAALIPWAKAQGAKVLRTHSPAGDIKEETIRHRRLVGYGFKKVSNEYERRI